MSQTDASTMTELLTTRDLLSPTFGHEKYPGFFFNKEGDVKSVSPTSAIQPKYYGQAMPDNMWVWLMGGFIGVTMVLYLLGRKK